MRGFLIGVAVVLFVVGGIVWAVVDYVGSRSAAVYNANTDPAVMQANYESMHAACSGVRKQFTQWQEDTKAVTAFEAANANVLNPPPGTKVDALTSSQVRQQLGVLQTVVQGDRDELAQGASDYDTLVETKTKNLGAKWVSIIFNDTGLPQSIQPPYDNVDCGSGVWPSAAAA